MDVTLSNNKQSQNTTDQSNVKVRLKPIPQSPQTKKNNKPVTNIKTTKPTEQKSIKKYSLYISFFHHYIFLSSDLRPHQKKQ